MAWCTTKEPPRRGRSAARAIAACALLAPLSLIACDDGAAGDGTIRIGVVGPTQLIYGESMRAAALMLQDSLNAAGGIGGRPVELVIRDDAADGETAIGIATEFVNDPTVAAVVGHVTSGAMLEAASLYDDGGLVAVSPTATNPDISRAGDWIFRVCPSDILHGPALARWLGDDLGARSAVVLFANDAYGRGILEGFAEEFEASGGRVVSRDPFLAATVQDTLGVRPYLRRAIARSAEALVIGGYAAEAAAIIQSARDLGFRGPILGGEALLGVEAAGAVTDGVYVSAPFFPDATTGEAREWVDAYEARYGSPPDAFAAQTWDALQLVVAAIDAVGPDREAIRAHLADVGRGAPAFEGVTGRIAFDENGDVPGKTVAIGQVRGGQVRAAER